MKNFLLAIVAIVLWTPYRLFAQSVPGQTAYKSQASTILAKLTTEEKISYLGNRNKGIARLGIKPYNWLNEGLHGVARAGEATIFPQANGMAASFNDKLLKEVASAIGTEARAKHNLAAQKGRANGAFGLTFWSPNINIFRDPRWGRGQETYGEDPLLTARMGVSFISGMQGPNPLQMKVAACAKHFAVHSGPETSRNEINVMVGEKDLRETYLPAFKALVDGGVESVMCAYNRLNGEPCCTNKTLLRTMLTDEWKFKGHVVTDCDALQDAYQNHKSFPDAVYAAAAAIKAGVNLDCSALLQTNLKKALQQNLITGQDLDGAILPLLNAQEKLGFFADSALSTYKTFLGDSVHNDYHKTLARTMAQQSMVLLKNDRNLLPLDIGKISKLTLIGPGASDASNLMGNYHAETTTPITYYQGIVEVAGPTTIMRYERGFDNNDTRHFFGISDSRSSDVTFVVLGITPDFEGEEKRAILSDSQSDRKDLNLPPGQIAFLKALRKGTPKPIVVIVTGGSALDLSEVEANSDAVLLAWYSGEQGGRAAADVLFGRVSPAGRLPVTLYKSISDLPDFSDYRMKGRTYRYFDRPVQHPFGFGLSYATFKYEWQKEPSARYNERDSLEVSVQVSNNGNTTSDEVVQLYCQYPNLPGMPRKELIDFKRVSVLKNGSFTTNFKIPITRLHKWNEQKHTWKVYPGTYTITAGGSSEDRKLTKTFQVAER